MFNSGTKPQLKSQPEKKSNPERMLSLQEAARYLSISESTMRRYLKDGKIPSHKIGGKLFRVFPADLDEFVAAQPR
jgi:excisionase family DNA binding protein